MSTICSYISSQIFPYSFAYFQNDFNSLVLIIVSFDAISELFETKLAFFIAFPYHNGMGNLPF